MRPWSYTKRKESYLKRREKAHRRFLRHCQGDDVKVNFTRYYWIDGRHQEVALSELISMIGKREAYRRTCAMRKASVSV